MVKLWLNVIWVIDLNVVSYCECLCLYSSSKAWHDC